MSARMVGVIGLVAGLGLSAVGAADDPRVEYQQFASSAGKYKILFPGPVRNETVEVKTAAGAQSLTLDSVSLADGTLFVVSYIDTPAEAARADSGPRLDKIRDAIRGPDGKLVSEKAVAVGLEKLPGRDVLVEKPGTVIRARVVLAERRLYQVLLQGSRGFVTSPTADRFFDSFEVTK